MVSSSLYGQFVNGDLNGTVATSVAPTNWQQVAFTDPVSLATWAPGATSDVTSMTGPAAGGGILGNPYSGSTFVTGLHASDGSNIWHEGIQQTLNGLSPGNSYTIYFYQSVVKQSNCTDQSGSWRIAVDNTIVGVTAPTFSAAPYNSTSFVWEQRAVTFAASSGSHTIKFLPFDDDPNLNCFSGGMGLRMGIDSITLSPPVVLSTNAIELNLEQNGEGIDLDWLSADQETYTEFILERSPDGYHFEPLETFPGDQRYSYTYHDRSPYNESFYRLAQKTGDGDISYSQIASIRIDLDLDFRVFGERLELNGHDQYPYDLLITDLEGRTVFSGPIIDGMDLSFLNAGVYVGQLMSHGPDVRRIVHKFSKY